MSSKITLPELVGLLSVRTGRSKRMCESFIKSLFGAVSVSLCERESVKIKGFGTFKLTEIEPRRSVDVNTGRDIEIAGHFRVSFVADKELAAYINRPFEMFESVELGDAVSDELLEQADVAPLLDETDKSSHYSKLTRDEAPDREEPCVNVPGEDDSAESDRLSYEVASSAEYSLEDVDSEYEKERADVHSGSADIYSLEGNDEEGDSASAEPGVIKSLSDEIPESGSSLSEVYDIEREQLSESFEQGDDQGEDISPAENDYDPIGYSLDEDEDEEGVINHVGSIDTQESDSDLQPLMVAKGLAWRISDISSVGVPERNDEYPKDVEERISVENHVYESEPPKLIPSEPIKKENAGKHSVWNNRIFLTSLLCVIALLAVAGVLLYKYQYPDRDRFVLLSEERAKADELKSDTSVESLSDISEDGRDSISATEVIAEPLIPEEIEPVKIEAEEEKNVDTKPSDRQKYDTISKTRYLTTMAKAHYGNYHLWPYIYEANKGLGHPDRIRPGTKIKIPDIAELGVNPSNPNDIAKAKRKGAEIYNRYKGNSGTNK